MQELDEGLKIQRAIDWVWGYRRLEVEEPVLIVLFLSVFVHAPLFFEDAELEVLQPNVYEKRKFLTGNDHEVSAANIKILI